MKTATIMTCNTKNPMIYTKDDGGYIKKLNDAMNRMSISQKEKLLMEILKLIETESID